MKVQWLVVGAGLTGATLAERIATVLGERVLVIDRRSHVAGNAFDELDETGLLVHRYGPHIFHTNSSRIWTYLRGFAEFRPYVHRVLASIDSQLTPLPFGFGGIDTHFPAAAGTRLKDRLAARFGSGKRIPIFRLRDDPDREIRRFADFVYERIFAGYTSKQWGMAAELLSPSVMARVPVAIGYDDRYFADRYQAVPRHGYAKMVGRMLDHPNIEVALGTDHRAVSRGLGGATTIYTGPIDEYFQEDLGALPYRSLRWEKRMEMREFALPVATVNYPNEHAYTRETEIKRITGQTSNRTAILREFPIAHVPGQTEPYYPIPTEENQARYKAYRKAAAQLPVWFCGRLGEYRYYNMDQAVAAALAVFGKIVKNRASR